MNVLESILRDHLCLPCVFRAYIAHHLNSRTQIMHISWFSLTPNSLKTLTEVLKVLFIIMPLHSYPLNYTRVKNFLSFTAAIHTFNPVFLRGYLEFKGFKIKKATSLFSFVLNDLQCYLKNPQHSPE